MAGTQAVSTLRGAARRGAQYPMDAQRIVIHAMERDGGERIADAGHPANRTEEANKTMYFSIQECLAAGWATFKRRPGFFVVATLLLFVISGAVSGLIDALTGSDHLALNILAGIGHFILQCFVSLATARFALRAVDSVDAVAPGDAWEPQYVLPFAAASILYGLMVGLGFVLLIVPGIIVAVVFAFWPYPVAEGAGPITALSYSRLITKGHRWRLFLFFLVLVLVNLLGVMALVVGLLVSIPVSALAAAHAYRLLAGMADERTRLDATPGGPRAPAA